MDIKVLIRKHPALGRLLGDGWRFLLTGGFNTLFTLLLYQALLFVFQDKVAWSLAWFSGLLLISFAYPKLVFRGGQLTWRRFALNLVYYLCSFLLSLALLTAFSRFAGARLAAFCVLGVTVPLNFVFSRLIFTARFSPTK